MPELKSVGSRAQVMHGNAKKTSGGLTKSQLKYNKQGRIVSRKASALAKKNNRLVKAGYVTKKGQFGAGGKMRGGTLMSATKFVEEVSKGFSNNSYTNYHKKYYNKQPRQRSGDQIIDIIKQIQFDTIGTIIITDKQDYLHIIYNINSTESKLYYTNDRRIVLDFIENLKNKNNSGSLNILKKISIE